MDSPNFEILECTLRDGSYSIDFQFTPEDTAIIAAALENAGFKYIEVGHGIGLNASNSGKGKAAATDEQYLAATANALSKANWGMFFIPGIGRHEDLEMAASYGMDFVRIGTNVNEIEQSKVYIKQAKRLGMYVSANLMKSYALPVDEFVEKAKLSEDFGADIVCLVDSAGTMLPEDVKKYSLSMKECLKIPIGLHCHDNLGLGIANVLSAIECGAYLVDSTLQGMGRGGGNPASEVILAVFKKKGIDLGINLNLVMDISSSLIKPLLRGEGWDPINITSGYAGFHSSYLKTILEHADANNIDPRDLIVSVCEIDQVDPSENMIDNVAKRIAKESIGKAGLHPLKLPGFDFSIGFDESTSDTDLSEAIQKFALEIKATAKKRGKMGVVNIVAALRQEGKALVSRFIQEDFDYVIGNITIDSVEQLEKVIKYSEGVIDVFLVDCDERPYLRKNLAEESRSLISNSQLFAYSDSSALVNSVAYQIENLAERIYNLRVVITGDIQGSVKLAEHLCEKGASVTLAGQLGNKYIDQAKAIQKTRNNYHSFQFEKDINKATREMDVLVTFPNSNFLITPDTIMNINRNGFVIDASIASLTKEAVEYGIDNQIYILRPDMRASLAGELASRIGIKRNIKTLMGRGEIAGVPVVAGGLIGRYGEIVVDSITQPNRVVGIADGRGRVILHDDRFNKMKETVELAIVKSRAKLD